MGVVLAIASSVLHYFSPGPWDTLIMSVLWLNAGWDIGRWEAKL